MILQDIKLYIKQRQQVSLADIATHFDVEMDTIKGMLDFWVQKGRIKYQQQQINCSSSCHCSAKEGQDIYIWNPQLADISIETRDK